MTLTSPILPYSPFTEAGHGFRSLALPFYDMDDGMGAADAFFADLEPEAAAIEGLITEEDAAAKVASQEADKGDGEPREGEGEGEPDEKPEGVEKPAVSADPDDAEIEVGGTKAKIRDFKEALAARVASNEATTAAQAARTAADNQALVTRAALDKAVERARARFAPFEKLDFLELSRRDDVSAEDFAAIRKEAGEAYEELRFFTEELGGVVKQQQARTQELSQAEGRATVAALTNPETGIKGWNDELYGQVLDYAIKSGANPQVAKSLTGEWAIRALHKAYLYDKGIAEAKAKIEKVVHKPSRVLQGGSGTQATSKSALNTAMARLKERGDSDSLTDAFFASMTADE